MSDSDDRDTRERALARARATARLLDDSVRVPGTPYRVGIDPILGVVPVSGDFVAALASLYIVFKAVEVGVPGRHVLVMLARILLEFVVGSIPVVGTLVDAAWKINLRNVAVMEAHVEQTE